MTKLSSCLEQLPDGYVKKETIDLQKDKKLALLVNFLSLALMLAMIALMFVLYPQLPQWLGKDPGLFAIEGLVVIAAIVFYIFVHEWIHGVCMKWYGAKDVHYGFTGMYAFAGTSEYIAKGPYLVIAAAPLVILGVLIALIQLVLPAPWKWVAWIVQVMNVSGAAGDLYCFWKMHSLPADSYVRDAGTSMEIFVPEK